MAVFFAYLFYFVASTASPLQRRWLAKTKQSEKDNQILFAFHISIIISILGLGLLFYKPFNLSGDFWLLGIGTLVCGIAGALSYVFSYVAQKHVEAGVTSVISNIYTPITIVLASVLLNERLTNIQILGATLLCVAMVIISKKHRVGKFTFDKYFVTMLLSGVFLGVLITAERYLQKTTGFTAGTLLSWWSTCICLGIAAFFTRDKYVYSKKDVTITGVLRFVQNLSWVSLVFVVDNLSIVSAVTTFKVVIMFVAGAMLLKEREDLSRKLAGAGVAVIGLLLMSL